MSLPPFDNVIDQHRFNIDRGPLYDDGTVMPDLPTRLPVRLIAFYLPQFHRSAENDRWWGAGFTEWTNVTKALPRFAGHYQPRLPGELGFYDLAQPATLRRQAELAKAYGIEGFCFHHYWFGGDRLLERPLANLLANPEIDLPFCVNWANENWTRRWDGGEQHVLKAQAYSPEDDIAFARSLEPLFQDPRYIRVRDRPLLMLYRPCLLPDAAATVTRWREHFARIGENPFIVMPQVFDDTDPRPYGMDGAAGFPPHRTRLHVEPIVADRLFDFRYRTELRAYEAIVAESTGYRPTGFRLFPGVCPSWDNEARSPGRGAALVGSTPDAYGAWLEQAARWITEVAPPDERIVFINAWNEWAEGTYLEPDRHYGYAYLAATAQTLGRLVGGAAAAPAAPVIAASRTSLLKRGARRVARRTARLAEDAARLLRQV